MADSDEAARKRAQRRREIKSKISELEGEVEHLEKVRQDLINGRAKLKQVEADVSTGMQSTEQVSTNLAECNSKRINDIITLYLEKILERAPTIKSNIEGYIGEIDLAIADMDSSISYRYSRIRYYQNQL